MNTPEELRTTIDIRHANGVWAELRIVNEGKQTVLIHNPGHYKPTEGWSSSRQAYDVAVLLSFHFLEMTLTGTDASPAQNTGIATRADHIAEPPLALKPSDALTISIPLHEFYELQRGVKYSLELTYGDSTLSVHAGREFTA